MLSGGVDASVTPVAAGVTIELCAGLVDKDCSLAETARQEVLEKCGYDVPVEQFQVIVASRSDFIVLQPQHVISFVGS